MANDPLDPVEFVKAAMVKLEVVDQNTEFARKLGLGMHGPSRVGRWLKPESRTKPDYDATMRILIACGWLNMDAKARPSALADRPGSDHQEDIGAAVAELLDGQRELVRLARADEARRTKRAAPKRRAAK